MSNSTAEQKKRFFRDGTSQHDRLLKALTPSFVSIEERSSQDLLEFVQKFSKHLKYLKAENGEGGSLQPTWEPFFSYDAGEIASLLDESIHGDEGAQQPSHEPHLALLFAFLKLLRYPRQQFDSLTGLHLEHYYKKVLGLVEKPAVPDQVHVLFELAKNEAEHLLAKGTLLSGGMDSGGNELIYATATKSIINRAEVSDLKTLHVRKKWKGLRETHEHDNKSDAAFMEMLMLALGSPESGDPLPLYPGVSGTEEREADFELLKELHEQAKNIDENDESLSPTDKAAVSYILDLLNFVDLADFNTCVDIQIREIKYRKQEGVGVVKPSEEEWRLVYEIIEQRAFRKRVNRRQREELLEKFLAADEAGKDPFVAVMNWALGDPHPGDPYPPLPEGLSLDTHLVDTEKGRGYVREQLCLLNPEYKSLISRRGSPVLEDRQEICRLLVRAANKKRHFSFPPVGIEEIRDISSITVLDSENGRMATAETFRPFGETVGAGLKAFPSTVGFAVTSPLLLLAHGTRTITLTLACKQGTLDREKVEALLSSDESSPFSVELSSDGEWLSPDQMTVELGDFPVGTPLREGVTEKKPGESGEIAPDDPFDPEKDLGRFLVYSDGDVYRVISVSPQGKSVGLELCGKSNPDNDDSIKAVLYEKADICLNALRFTFIVGETQNALMPPEAEVQGKLSSSWPVISVNLCSQGETENDVKLFPYDLLKFIRCARINLKVAAEDVPVSCIRNDDTVLKAKSPFEPFGTRPIIGSGFYFSAEELCSKKIDSMDLQLEWMGLPANFASHYQAYCTSTLLNKAEVNTSSFKARLSLYDNGLWLEQNGFEKENNLFADDGTKLLPNVNLGFDDLGILQPRQQQAYNDDAVDPFECSRYFKLEVAGLGFQHEIYPLVVNWAAVNTAASIAAGTNPPAQEVVYPPYTPKVKSLTLGYCASEELVFSAESGDEENEEDGLQVYHLYPFGYSEITSGSAGNSEDREEDNEGLPSFLPQFAGEGYLHIGISDLEPNQEISLLFQVVAGSGEVDVDGAEFSWQYLAVDGWKTMNSTDILEDSTSGLLDSGLIRVHLPVDATDQATLMPAGRFWLRIISPGQCTALADIIDIKAQAVRAVFVDHNNADDHLRQPLAAGSIAALKERNPAIKGIRQPYGSFEGRRKESNQSFFRRVSERLRHGDRALTVWDYERLVLDQFPEIYKAKCLNRSVLAEFEETMPGEVKVVVVPDISHAAPFFPLEPRAPLYLLHRIEEYLMQRTPPAVSVQVRNPLYEQIQYRIGVQFMEGCRSGYYLKKLNEDVKRYLSPWAYEGNAEIPISSSIHNANLIHYLEGLDYVDFIAHLKLIEQRLLGRGGQGDTVYPVDDSGTAYVHRPDAILVSAPNHIIDFIIADAYEEVEFEGIGYMIIGKDFIISEDSEIRREKIGEMTIGKDFQIV